MTGYARKTGDAHTAQVVTLLNQLGDRMVRGERERAAVRQEMENTRALLSGLQNQAEKTERIFLTMQDSLAKKESTADALIERQNNLERLYRDSAERLRRAEALTSQIEEAIALQNRLARRLEKTAQDKVRILSKIERIEAAVEETRQSLTSGKLVGITVPHPPANDPSLGNVLAGTPWWKASLKTRAATIGSLLIAGLLGGVAISQLLIHWPQGIAAQTPTPQVVSAVDSGYVSPYGTQSVPRESSLPASTSTDQYDLAPYGEDAMVAAMEQSPDALAAALNEIEPSVGAQGVVDENAPVQNTPAQNTTDSTVQPVSVPPQQAAQEQVTQKTTEPVTDRSVEDFVKANSRSGTPLAQRMTADAALPPAIQAIEKKAFEGIPEAQHDLAAIYTAGHGGVAVDYKRAAQWFTEAAGNGIANARYNLGVLYHQGLGVDRDIAKAIGWYRAAAALGHPEAEYNLGIAEIEGIGTAYNPRRAAQSFENAARGGVMEAAYNLGLIHENGLLGDPDLNEAVFWYSVAADYSPESRVALNHVTKIMGLKQSDIERIVREYGAVYNLPGTKSGTKTGQKTTAPKTEKKAEAAPIPAQGKSDVTAAAALTAQDQAALPTASADPAALARVIPPLSSDDSRNLLNAVRNDQAMIAQIQEQLMRLGLYPGPADGLGGPQTEDAIRAYQTRNNVAVTGKPSEDLLVRMLASELNAAAGQ